jgi:hypothetical protein
VLRALRREVADRYEPQPSAFYTMSPNG